ncbi:MAG: nucleoside recognition domain-containing protein [Prevotellaceae bacterium]|nr:nucleoside recognition domain-containing protein [Prevotellaceae bacterium]MDD6009638.1 nucleoside recognition domain-containing protein [Prevotellaceae bacterium]MDD6111194.1 nucleoside recognition domain-containing protein [Prevotellaceae bacterium]MDD6780181.1 nucleoside recognition domain-containing protein [Prevotellaceae bacterium]
MEKIFDCFKQAVPASWKSTRWLLKLMIPISLAVTLMQHFGILAWIATWINPMFVHFGLPGESAVAFISGAAAGTYAGLAVMMSIPLTMKQASILALMIALCHALPMECAVNKKTGSSFWNMAVIRIVMALLCAFTLNLLLPEIAGKYIYLGAEADSSLAEVTTTWVLSQVKMSLMVMLIIFTLMVVQRMLEAYRLLDSLSRLLSPLMLFFGLPRHASYMWLVGNVLGISYGSAVMLELEEKGLVTKDEANDVNYHLIMNHSMLEDTIVFAATGISAILLITTRVSFALLLVWGRKLTTRKKP